MNTGADRLRSSLSVVRVYEASRSAAYDDVRLPDNIKVPQVYVGVLRSMLERSATFRRQCARIARAEFLTVTISKDPPAAGKGARAWTEILRLDDDRIEAFVQVGAGSSLTELIAHELEHVIEQLDGVNLRTMSRVGSTGVRQCECSGQAYETHRAIAIGEKVAQEMRQRSP